jgi:hypothetical protein
MYVGGDFARDASGARVGRSAFKKGSISRVVGMPRSTCIHRALPPFGPPYGVRRCSLEGSASGPSPPAISSPKSLRSWRCHRTCLLLVVVRGVQPHGGWHSFAIARIQGFSSCSQAAISHQWSSRGMITSLVVGRSKPGCGLPPALSFKDVHHPCWGGGCAELGPRLPHGLAVRFFPQYPGEKGVRQSCEGGTLRVRGAGRRQVSPATACPMLRPRWLWHRLQCCLLLLGRGVVVRSPHGRQSRRAQVRHTHGHSRTTGRTRGLYMASYVAGAAAAFLDVLTPVRMRARIFSHAEAVVAHRCRGGCRRWCDYQFHLPSSLQLFGFNGLVVAPVGRRGRGPFCSGVHAEVIAAAGES